MALVRWSAALGGLLIWVGSLGAQDYSFHPFRARLDLPLMEPGSAQHKKGKPAPSGVKGVVPAAWQRPDRFEGDDILPYVIQLAPPGPERLFQLESEEALRERIRHEGKLLKRKIVFPEAVYRFPAKAMPGRTWDPLPMRVEPCYLCYGRVWFEQRNFERQGWSLGVFQPWASTGIFLVDVATLPLSWLRDPLRYYECSSGLCLPGEPTPFLWYRRTYQ